MPVELQTMGKLLQWERWRRRRLFVAAALLFVVVLVLSIWWTGPGPPRRIVLATGSPEGGNTFFGKKYQKRLAQLGLAVEIVHTNGSQENLELLVRNQAQVAFIQGGIYSAEHDPEGIVRGMAALYREPLWFFHRGSPKSLSLSEFKGKRIAIGPSGSGIEAVGTSLLQANGINGRNATINTKLSMANASAALKKGDIDMALFVTPETNPLVLDLLHFGGVRLLSFRQQDAYCRRFPYLTPITLPEGVIDLENNVPGEPIPLLATAAILACREDLHPRAVEEILDVAQSVHATANLVDPAQKYPSLKEMDMPIHEAAERYLRTGESFLTRLLPYWAIRLIYRAQVLLLPLLVVWIPFLKVLPAIYAFRINRLLRHHYVALREAETAIEQAKTPAEVRNHLQVLENMRTTMEKVSRKVPGHLQRDVYHWRSHVQMVKEEGLARLKKLEERPAT